MLFYYKSPILNGGLYNKGMANNSKISPRRYSGDFEEYGINAQNPNNAENFSLYIS